MNMTRTITLPSKPYAEKCVIGACMCSIDILNEAVSILEPSDFLDVTNNRAFGSMREMYMQNKPVNPFSLIANMGKIIRSEQANEILKCENYYDKDISYESYFEEIKEASNLRKIHFESRKASEESIEGKKTSSILIDQISKNFVEMMSRNKETVKKVKEVTDDFEKGKTLIQCAVEKSEKYRRGEPVFDGVLSSYAQLDETIGAFRNGCLHYIGARTSVGKTSFLLNLIKNIMDNNPEKKNCFSFS